AQEALRRRELRLVAVGAAARSERAPRTALALDKRRGGGAAAAEVHEAEPVAALRGDRRHLVGEPVPCVPLAADARGLEAGRVRVAERDVELRGPGMPSGSRARGHEREQRDEDAGQESKAARHPAGLYQKG